MELIRNHNHNCVSRTIKANIPTMVMRNITRKLYNKANNKCIREVGPWIISMSQRSTFLSPLYDLYSLVICV